MIETLIRGHIDPLTIVVRETEPTMSRGAVKTEAPQNGVELGGITFLEPGGTPEPPTGGSDMPETNRAFTRDVPKLSGEFRVAIIRGKSCAAGAPRHTPHHVRSARALSARHGTPALRAARSTHAAPGSTRHITFLSLRGSERANEATGGPRRLWRCAVTFLSQTPNCAKDP